MGSELNAEILRSLLICCPDTGRFFNRIKRGNTPAGVCAGTVADEYVRIRVHGRLYRAHRLVWLYIHGTWPQSCIDHINRDKKDNRLSNLRLADRSQNGANMRRRRDNTSGFKGVSWDRRTKKWSAYIYKGGKQFPLGKFESPEDGHAAYMRAASQAFGSFAHSGE